jgi:hypothetical protein
LCQKENETNEKEIQKILWVSLGLLSIISIAGWYYFPYLAYKFTNTNEKYEKYLRIKPTYINNLIIPPHEWDDIQLGGISIKLPTYKCNKIDGQNNSIRFAFGSEQVIVSDIAPTKDLLDVIEKNKLKYPTVSYQDRVAVFKSSPTDVTIFNSRSNNMQAYVNQTLKFISVPIGGISEIYIIKPEIIKAVFFISEKRKNGYSAFADIYSQNERNFFTIMLRNYSDKNVLMSDMLTILGGITVSDHVTEIEKSKEDINTVVRKYAKTQPAPRPAQ